MLELAQLLFSTFHQTALAVSYGAKFEGESVIFQEAF